MEFKEKQFISQTNAIYKYETYVLNREERSEVMIYEP